MPPIEPIAATAASLQLALPPAMPVAQPIASAPAIGFVDMLSAGMEQLQSKLDNADAVVRRFALDESVPVHQVTMALEEARLAVELAMQVRGRLVESYRDFMAMQL